MDLFTIHLFAGAGGGILADKIIGHTPIGAVEIEEYPRRVLLQRQLDGFFPPFPIWDDVTTFSESNPECAEFFQLAKEVRGKLAICGGFPCQDISAAGKGAGITGEKSGLWKEFARIIREVRPAFVFVENSPMLTVRGLGAVLGDLAALGYDANWCVLGAHHAGAPHRRDRIWILGNTKGQRDLRRELHGQDNDRSLATGTANMPKSASKAPYDVADANLQRCEKQQSTVTEAQKHPPLECRGWWKTEPGLDRVANGVARRMDRLKAIGNGQVPHTAAMAWKILMDGFEPELKGNPT